jgi:hypothetical protein
MRRIRAAATPVAPGATATANEDQPQEPGTDAGIDARLDADALHRWQDYDPQVTAHGGGELVDTFYSRHGTHVPKVTLLLQASEVLTQRRRELDERASAPARRWSFLWTT